MQLLLRWAISAAALYATVWLLHLLGQADLQKGPWYAWFVAVIIMAGVNALIRPIANLLTAPLNCLTFGILGIIINGLMFALVPVAAQGIGMSIFALKWPWGPFMGALLIGPIGGLLSNLLIRSDEK